jgi:hypothetical protein
MPQQKQATIEELRANYYRLIDQILPKRAKGIPFTRILGPSLLMWVFSYLTFIFIFYSIGIGLLFLVGVVFTWFFWSLPAEFYDDRKRTYRHAKRYYPAVLRTLAGLREQDNKNPDLPVLKIAGNKYFLIPFIYQHWWDPKPNAKFTGWILLDDLGKIIANDDLFEKAFLTYHYESLGAFTTQQLDGESRVLSNDLRYQLPQAKIFLHSQRAYFDQSGQLQDWQSLMDRIPILHEAGKDALSIYKGRENFRRAMGYSFGLEFDYEDALLEEQMNRAFSRYMLKAYGEQLDALRTSLTRLIQSVENQNGSGGKRLRLDSLNQTQKTTLAISNLIVRMQQKGIPSQDDWVLYRAKLALAKERGFIIVHQPRQNDESAAKWKIEP